MCICSLLFLLCEVVVFSRASAADLVVGVGLPKPPFILTDNQSGAEIEVVKRSFELAGVKAQIKSFPQRRLMYEFNNKRIDATITVKESTAYLSDPYITYTNVAISKNTKKISIKSIANLGSYRVASFQNALHFLGPIYSRTLEKNSSYKEFPNQSDQIALLLSDRVDVVIMERNIFAYLIGLKGLNPHEFLEHRIFDENHYRVAFNTDEARNLFNKGLHQLKKSGEYQRIFKKYKIKSK